MHKILLRHWRGELSLPVSFWINGFLLSITLYLLSASAVAASAWQLQLFGASLGMVGIPIIGVWQLIGIYRSAKPRVGFWPGTARLCVGFGWLRLIGYVAALVVSVNSEQHQQHTVANRPTPPAAQASTGLQYSYSYIRDNKLIIHVRGRITAGDAARFPKWVTDNIKTEDRIAGVALDSPGGSVHEALLFAAGVKANDTTTIVGNGEKCVSACFLIFAAGKKRFATKDAFIGVHSVVIKGEGETLDAKGGTLDLARIATEKFSVPPSIIGRMVATPPDKVYRLNQSDLVEMGVQIIEPSVDKPSPEPSIDKPSSLTYTSRPGWKNANGEDCREYKFTKGNFETYGTSCRDAGGQWRTSEELCPAGKMMMTDGCQTSSLPISFTYTSRSGWTDGHGKYCRQYKFTQGFFESYGTACRDANGQWWTSGAATRKKIVISD